ncbi:hypothetical protein FRC07_006251 [Ceratobasidium sp. 392]|nr:hypothetical protein FRC07_006251 [Ceratobasidium sp. 392]
MTSSTPNDTTPSVVTDVHEKAAENAVKQSTEMSTEQAVSKSSSEESEAKESSNGPSTEDKDGEAEASKPAEDEANAGDDENPPLPDEPVPAQTEWQAIWAPTHNAYYFYNSRTGETTWVNPLDPSSSASTSTVQPQHQTQPETDKPKQDETKPEEEEAPRDLSYLNGIDPDLAYLDPTLAVPPAGAKGPVPTFSARFGARSGKFTAMDGRQPEHLSEAARAQRMSSVYFDTAAWEKEIAERDAKAKADEEAGVGDKRKRPTKADIERFKAQKQAKKALRNAWLRE